MCFLRKKRLPKAGKRAAKVNVFYGKSQLHQQKPRCVHHLQPAEESGEGSSTGAFRKPIKSTTQKCSGRMVRVASTAAYTLVALAGEKRAPCSYLMPVKAQVSLPLVTPIDKLLPDSAMPAVLPSLPTVA